MNNALLIVLLEIIFIWGVVIWVYNMAAQRDRRAPIDDIGVFWLSIFALYGTLSPLSWLLQGGTYGLISGRLFQMQPSADEVMYVMNIELAYIIGFASVYFVMHERIGCPAAKAQARIDDTKMAGAVVILLAASLIGVAISASGLIRAAESYADAYKTIQELPLGLKQFIKMVSAFSSVATLVLLVAVLQRWPRYRLIFIFYLASILLSINLEGGRSGLATGLLGIAISWHVLVRPIPSGRLLTVGIFGFVSFQVLGIWRDMRSLMGIGELVSGGYGVGEFETTWANAVQLWQAKSTGAIGVPMVTRFGELFAFIPSQLLWFDKISLADWYLTIFYPDVKAMGGGMAFGAIGQAVIGYGVFEAAIRGAILGALACWIMNWIRKPSKTWWRFPLHLYLLIWCFQGIRDTTFRLWGDVVQTVLPAFIVITIFGRLLTTRNIMNHRQSDTH